MRNYNWLIICIILILSLTEAQAYYGKQLCGYPEFSCTKVKRGDTWEKRWPDPEQRDLVKRINRINLPLANRSLVVVPKHLANLTMLDLAPFPSDIHSLKQKTIIVDLTKLAFGAYDRQGHLIYWGPVSGGREWCKDIDAPCETPLGEFRIFRKQGEECVSSQFPIEEDGGAPMPYCMHFSQGVALHGSEAVPGYNASHGCVRLYIEDAQWLNQEFADIGTTVIVTRS